MKVFKIIRENRWEFFMMNVLSYGSFATSMNTSWLTVIIPKITDAEQTPLNQIPNLNDLSILNSFYVMSLLISAYLSAPLPNACGRKGTMYIGAIVSITSWTILAFSSRLYMLIIGRTLVGAGHAAFLMATMMYRPECSTPAIRGITITIADVVSAAATVSMYLIGPHLTYQNVTFVCLVSTIIYVGVIYLMPESPAYYLIKGRREEAENAFIYLRHCTKEEAKEAADSLEDAINANQGKKNISELWRKKSNIKAMIICTVLMLMLILSGSYVLEMFASTIFVGTSLAVEPFTLTIIIGFIKLASSCVIPFVIDTAGRRPLMIVSTLMSAIILLVFGVYFFLDAMEISAIQKINWLPILLVVIFYLFHGIGFNTVPGMLAGELLDINVKAIASAIINTLVMTVTFAFALLYGTMTESIGNHGMFWLFCGASIVALVFTIFFMPETKGRSLKEIQDELNSVKRNKNDIVL